MANVEANDLVTCRKCGSTDTYPTSSQQMLLVGGEKRLHAEMVCRTCDHTWWSRNDDAIRRSRELDQGRKDDV